MMKTAEVRRRFLQFFEKNTHTIVKSSSLIPHDDKTLLFVNAGMVQFKQAFLGAVMPEYSRAVSAQRCVRAGGKHNDLENVGYTARHHTLFEMLGNFSFGDYFKEDAIQFAWSFLTDELQLSKEKLWVTVYVDDDEAYAIWRQVIGLSEDRIIKISSKDNFWEMGETGPCGPCSEIFYDHGPAVAGGLPGTPEEDGDRYVEIWNLVFMQYNRQSDGTLEPLPKPCVDTGMGLERVSAVMQGVHNNYDIDLFRALIQAIVAMGNIKDSHAPSLRVIADHIRSCAFLVADGVTPSNEGRGYVLRRILRRALRHGYQLGIEMPFFYHLVAPLVEEMGEAYPELVSAQARISTVLLEEEKRFAQTLEQGMKVFHQCLRQLEGETVPGDIVFRLYDTYGFPVDLTADMARESGLKVDFAGFEEHMGEQRERARKSNAFKVDYNQQTSFSGETAFDGYHALTLRSEVTALYQQEGRSIESLSAGEEGIVCLDRSPFYAESGGQVGDRGMLKTEQGAVFEVLDTQKQGAVILHQGRVCEGRLQKGEWVSAEVNVAKRRAVMRHHSATHLLHAALRSVLGEHVMQKGSLVNEYRLRFDFTHAHPLSQAERVAIEDMVNAHIIANVPVVTEEMAFDQAKSQGALAFFDEKYEAHVRVLSMGAFSKELCGGTHVHHTGEIGVFKIISETGVASGVRRIEAVTADQALSVWHAEQAHWHALQRVLKVPMGQMVSRCEALLEEVRLQEKKVAALVREQSKGAMDQLLQQVQNVDGVNVLVTRLDAVDPKSLRDMLDQLKAALKHGIIVLAAVNKGRISLIAGVTDTLTERFHAGELVKHIALQVDGKGGGRADMAQGGGQNETHLAHALNSVLDWVNQHAQ